MNDRTRRINYARLYLGIETNDQRITIRWLTPSQWDGPAQRRLAGDHHALGFAPPVALADGSVVMACAEVLVDASATLAEPEFFGYVASVRTHLQLHLIQTAHRVEPDLVELGVLAEQREVTDLDFATFERLWTHAQEGP